MCFDERKCTFPLGAHQTHVRQRAITAVCSVDWRKGPHVEDLYYGLVCTPQHLSLVANIWIVYRGTDLVVASIMRRYNIPNLLRYPIFWLISQFLVFITICLLIWSLWKSNPFLVSFWCGKAQLCPPCGLKPQFAEIIMDNEWQLDMRKVPKSQLVHKLYARSYSFNSSIYLYCWGTSWGLPKYWFILWLCNTIYILILSTSFGDTKS